MAAQALSLSTPASIPARSSHFVLRRKPATPSPSPSPATSLRPQNLHCDWLGATKVSFQPFNLKLASAKHLPIRATVVSSLPTAYPERASSSEKVPKWSSKAIKSYAMGELEARKLKYPSTGTEAILMGILIEGTNPASKFLLANGISLFKVRDESIKILGKGDLYFFSPEHPPLTESAQKAIDWAIDEKLKSGENGEVTTVHLLLGVWSEKEAAGHKILAALGFTDDKAEEIKDSISKPGFTD